MILKMFILSYTIFNSWHLHLFLDILTSYGLCIVPTVAQWKCQFIVSYSKNYALYAPMLFYKNHTLYQRIILFY